MMYMTPLVLQKWFWTLQIVTECIMQPNTHMQHVTLSTNKKCLWSNVQAVLDYMRREYMALNTKELYKSLPSRVQAIIAAHGGNTRYRGEKRSWSM